MTEAVAERGEPVSLWQTCDACNYAMHRCHFCAEELDHEGFQADGTRHMLSVCRPDLVEHEPGPLCTWPAVPEMGDDWNREHGLPGCYAYQNPETREWTEEHRYFFRDGPMG